MTAFSKTHIIFLLVSALFLILGFFACKKLKPKWQNFVFLLCALFCAVGIVFRYGFGLGQREFSLKTLLMQMLQVCNFNLILVILMLIPKCELARQYSLYFSSFCALTMLISLPSDWKGRQWYDIYIINSWLNHLFAVALPLFMVACKKLKPQKKYIWRVALCVFLYFTAVYGVSELLIQNGLLSVEKSFSFIYRADGVAIFEMLYSLIKMPYFYLFPLFPVLIAFFYALYWVFKPYKLENFNE